MFCCCCADDPVEPPEYHRWPENTPAPPPPQTVGIDDFELLKVLGRGSYGKVMQVRRRGDNKIYAMKAMQKSDVASRNQVRHALTERKLLACIRGHPFIVPLEFAFQSESHLYLVLALQSGGELFFHLRRDGAFTETRARLYAAEILLALEAIHTAGFVYRDLKPENVLLDGEGHVRLSDFGLAKEAKGDDSLETLSTKTFCGTPSYMAPEVLLGTGHGVPVDWWSLGTLIFEMLSGCPPFYSRNLHAMYKAILTAELRLGPHITKPARALLKGLLTRDPIRRLGSKGSSSVRRSAFFRPLDFKLVSSRGYTPSFVPTLIGSSPSMQALDVSNFDENFTMEDPHSNEQPSPQPRQQQAAAAPAGELPAAAAASVAANAGASSRAPAPPPVDFEAKFANWSYSAEKLDAAAVRKRAVW